jgi:hypothetical protein
MQRISGWKFVVVSLAIFVLGAGPAFGASTEILRLKFSETVVGGAYAQGQVIFDGVAPNQDGTVQLLGTAPGFLTQVTNPVSSFGQALKFGTTSCTDAGCTQLGHVSIPDTTGIFSPHTQNFEWGASVRLNALPTGTGMNVVQKGRSGNPDMWKLQLDGGVASCVIRVDGGALAIAKTDSALPVGRTFKLRCKRVSGVLTLTVTELIEDGMPPVDPPPAPVVYGATPTSGSAAGELNDFGPTNAVFVGGKGTIKQADQLRDTVIDTVTYWAG